MWWSGTCTLWKDSLQSLIALIKFCSFLHLGFFHFLLSLFLSLIHFAFIKWDISPKSCIEKLLMGIFRFNLITVFSNGFPSVSQYNAILASHLLFSNISYFSFLFLLLFLFTFLLLFSSHLFTSQFRYKMQNKVVLEKALIQESLLLILMRIPLVFDC